MTSDVLVIGSLAILGTLFFSLVIGFSVILVPLPFMVLIIPMCLAGQFVYALHIEDIAKWAGYKFRS